MNKLTCVILMSLAFYQPAIANKEKSCPPPPPGAKVDESCKVATIENPSNCLNKTVYVVAKPDKYESIKHFFMLFSNLPYEVTEIKKEKTKTLIAISYWGEGPNSLVLSERIRSNLESKFTEFGVQSIRAEFDIKSSCK